MCDQNSETCNDFVQCKAKKCNNYVHIDATCDQNSETATNSCGRCDNNMANSRNIVPNCMYGLAISQRYGAILSDTCVAISHESATVSWAFEQYFGASWLMQGTLHMAVRWDGRCATHRASSVCTSSVSTMSRQGSLHTSPVSTWSRQGSLLT